MADYEAFTCPYCQQPTQLSSSYVARDSVTLSIPNADGPQSAVTTYRVCPNIKCRKPTLRLHTVRLKKVMLGESRVAYEVDGENALLRQWVLLPTSTAKTFDAPVPKAIV